jgi:hypothetical protein
MKFKKTHKKTRTGKKSRRFFEKQLLKMKLNTSTNTNINKVANSIIKKI